MTTIYEVHTYPNSIFDVDTEEKAVEAIEKNGSGFFVTFVRDFRGKDRSCAMKKYENGVWVGVDITR